MNTPIEDFSRFEYHHEIGLDLDNIELEPINEIIEEEYAGNVYDLKVDNIANYINEDLGIVHNGGGKRKGSFAFYLEPWHIDIEVLINMRKNHGKEELRARDLFNALWIPDEFMRRIKNKEPWYLFCPNEIKKAKLKPLQEVVGDDFVEEYNKAISLFEKGKLKGKKINIEELWRSILIAQMETGTPYMLYKDACNLKSNQQNLGVIKSSNLCTEVVEFSSPTEQAVCNLASISLSKLYNKETDEIDYNKLERITYRVTKNLNTVIDRNIYPTKETKNSNLKHRPIGIGIQGLADLFAQMKIPFTSKKAKKVNKLIFETIYYAALKASNDLAKEKGTYSSYKGSPLSKGQLQFDMWGVEPFMEGKWEKLRKSIKEFGIYNSLLVAPMPTASTSQIMGNIEAFEPFKSNIYTRRVLSGEFVIINKYLIEDLEELDIWNREMKNKIIMDNGSIQNIDSIPDNIKELYKTVWELSMKDIIDMAADRGAFIDQSQSMNLFMETPTIGKLNSMHFYGWDKGLKTGMYYLKSKPSSSANKSLGIDTNIKKDNNLIITQEESDFDCLACGS